MDYGGVGITTRSLTPKMGDASRKVPVSVLKLTGQMVLSVLDSSLTSIHITTDGCPYPLSPKAFENMGGKPNKFKWKVWVDCKTTSLAFEYH